MEALVRWKHPTRGLLAPGVFIPIAEKTGAIVPLGHWVLDQACRQMKLWRDQGVAPSVVAVNLSLHQLKHGQALVRDVSQTLAHWDLPPSDLEFDVTEATLAQLKWTQNDVLPRLHALGVKIAIDGFGSEYSSFDYVKEFRVNHLKIAASLISDAVDSDESAAMRAIVTFAREMGITVIAQGVETEEQRRLLRQTDPAAQAQGFHFSKAVSAEQAGGLLREGFLGERKSSTA
jgi:EAL domain-containing protein (putative c-di-GMP-specific phosphodiesterase class I)